MKKILTTVATLSAGAYAWLFVAASNASAAPISGGVGGGASSARGADQPADLFGVGGTFSTITNIMLFIVGAVAVIMIVVGGLRYVTSGGDQAHVTAAKNTILYAIIGIIVSLLAYAAIRFIIDSIAPGSGSGTNV